MWGDPPQDLLVYFSRPYCIDQCPSFLIYNRVDTTSLFDTFGHTPRMLFLGSYFLIQSAANLPAVWSPSV